MSITDCTKSTEERWLEARKNHKDVLVKCKVCDGHLLPHRDGGWLHWDGILDRPFRQPTHEPVAVWSIPNQSVKRLG